VTGRTPACEDAGIAERMREIQRDRMQAIAGCYCTQRDTAGNTVHLQLCPLRQAQPSQMVATLEAMQRARARVYRRVAPDTPPLTADEIIERGIAEKYARHRVLT
jgi:hypothetical protein